MMKSEKVKEIKTADQVKVEEAVKNMKKEPGKEAKLPRAQQAEKIRLLKSYMVNVVKGNFFVARCNMIIDQLKSGGYY